MFPPKSPVWTQILMAAMQGKAKPTTAKRRHIRRNQITCLASSDWLHLSFSFGKIWPQESLESHSIRKDCVWLQMIRHMTNSGLNIPSVTRNLEVDSITMSPVKPRTQTSFCSTLLFPPRVTKPRLPLHELPSLPFGQCTLFSGQESVLSSLLTVSESGE